MWALVLATATTLVVCSLSAGDHSDDVHTVRVCASSPPEADSCRTLDHYYHNHSHLRVDCQQRDSTQQCYQDFLGYKVDVLSLNPRLINNYFQVYRHDAYKEIDETIGNQLPLVIVNKSSTIERLAGTMIEKACISNLRDIPSWWTAHVYALSRASHGRYNSPYSTRYRTGMVFGTIEVTDDPLGCLGSSVEGVAILAQDTAAKKFGGGSLKAKDYELVCRSGGRKPVDDYSTCNGYGLNFAGDSAEIARGKEVLKNLAHDSYRYSNIDYFDLLYNYKGDLKVFFSNATSAASLMEKEFSMNYFP